MNYNEEVNNYDVNFEGIEEGYFLVGLLSAFNNLYQTTADAAIKEISWKQMFSLICINMCKVAPSINELADIMESSHQNVKQILLKLEKKGFIYFETDEKDKRKQRIYIAGGHGKQVYEQYFCRYSDRTAAGNHQNNCPYGAES